MLFVVKEMEIVTIDKVYKEIQYSFPCGISYSLFYNELDSRFGNIQVSISQKFHSTRNSMGPIRKGKSILWNESSLELMAEYIY
jgi:hypothetical protein